MQRETKSFATPSGIEIVLKTYLTAREANSIKDEMYKMMKIDPQTGGSKSEITGEFLLEQERKALALLVVSINGNSENILETLLDMRNSDYQSIVKEMNSIQAENLTPVK